MSLEITLDNLIKSCQEIVRIPGESGEEKEVALYFKKLMEELGFDRVWIDDVGNVIGMIEGEGEENILLEGHLDTVGVENEELWEFGPYSGEIAEGKLYGRGTSDMRSAVVAMAFAAAELAKKKEQLQGNIIVAGTVQEEIFEGVAQGRILDELDIDLVVIGEATSLNLAIGQRGRAEIKLITYGESAHSSSPEAGVNAVKLMLKLLTEIEELKQPEDEFLGTGILELTDIHSNPYPGRSVLPEKCLVTFDRRLLAGETKDSVLAPIEEIIDDFRAQDDNFKAEVNIAYDEGGCYTGNKLVSEKFFPAWAYNEAEEFVQTAYAALKEVGLDSEIDHYSFCTDGSQSAGERGIATIGFGPSDEELAHVVDEYIELEQLEAAFKGYQALLESFLMDRVE